MHPKYWFFVLLVAAGASYSSHAKAFIDVQVMAALRSGELEYESTSAQAQGGESTVVALHLLRAGRVGPKGPHHFTLCLGQGDQHRGLEPVGHGRGRLGKVAERRQPAIC